MKLRHSHAIILSGLIWMGVGILLLIKGIQYIILAGNQVLSGTHQGFSLIQFLSRFSKNSEQAALILIAIALMLGFLKGRFVLKRTVNRVVARIRSHPSPLPVKAIYSKGYFILLFGMMLFGMVFKILPLPLDVKGFIDFTIGAALINGAMLYFRALVPQSAR
ncbi:MAG: hypothetical protein K1060chlam2_01042 [Chlamydiae bacterium]|nr:hypothetical protein [Chlamydiota bacterium]